MKIVVGVDGSEVAARAVGWCARFAPVLDAEVVAVHAVELPVFPNEVGFCPAPLYTPQDRSRLAEMFAEKWCAPLKDAGVEFRTVLADGYPERVIEQVADDESADLVVVGRRGLGGFTELLLGSTSHQLAHHVHRPLVIVP